ncbi:ABC transporter ATP-binding protein [Cribrihabitans pelagius]|uniref:ABC transporter ATP-binding protein n=1 Tax=Cribrihabitans pelagius TaxID=1765746 RepID=UPI003B5B117C
MRDQGTTSGTIIDLSGVEKRFGTFVAVRDLTLSLREGEFFSLLGPSGCGKTTALRMIAGFQDHDAGSIRIAGQDVAGIPANKRPTNMVFQSYAIFPHLNVGDNVAFGLRKLNLRKAEINARVAEALEMVELGGMQTRKADELSGGQRQRVALARALVMRPKVLLLDEPLSALDKNLRETMQFEMRQLQQKLGITFVMVTHDQYEAMTMSDRIGVMFQGKLKQVDRPEVLYARPASREVAAFIGGMNFLGAEITGESGGLIRARVQGFGPLGVTRNPNVRRAALGRDLLVGIRPEQLEIAAAKPDGYDGYLEGTVTNAAFYGESVHYHVRAHGLEGPIAVAVPNYFHTVDHKQGDRVWLGVQNASLIDLGAPADAE